MGKLKISFALIAMLALSGCATHLPSAPPTLTPPSTPTTASASIDAQNSSFCLTAQPHLWSVKDPDAVKEFAKEQNAKFKALCPAEYAAAVSKFARVHPPPRPGSTP